MAKKNDYSKMTEQELSEKVKEINDNIANRSGKNNTNLENQLKKLQPHLDEKISAREALEGITGRLEQVQGYRLQNKADLDKSENFYANNLKRVGKDKEKRLEYTSHLEDISLARNLNEGNGIPKHISKKYSNKNSNSSNTANQTKSANKLEEREPITFTDADVKEAEKITAAEKLNAAAEPTIDPTNNATKQAATEAAEEPDGLFKSTGKFFKGMYEDMKNNRMKNMTDYAADAEKARKLGFELRESKLSKISNQITGNLTPRYSAVNQMTGASISIDGLSKLSGYETRTWMEGHIYDYAKNASPGDPIDIFTHHEYSDGDKELYERRNEISKERLEKINELQKDPSNLSEDTKRILENNKKELNERISAYETPGVNNRNIPSERIIPDQQYTGERVADSIRENERVAGQTHMKYEYGNKLFGMKSDSLFSHRFGHGQEGGFGLGFSGAMKASRGKHFSRFAQASLPLGYGASTLQGLREGAAILNKHQAIQFKTAGFGGRLMLGLGSALPAMSVIKDIYEGDEPSDVVKDVLSNVGFMNGWRRGSALGGALTKESTVARAIGLGIGGASGALLGSALWSGAVDLAVDVTSNTSKVRAVARNMASKEMYAQGEMTNKALTMRQAGLQKLARSGLNDRGLLLGNEASVLAGAM